MIIAIEKCGIWHSKAFSISICLIYKIETDLDNARIRHCLIDTPYCTPHQARDKESYLPNLGGAIKRLGCFEATLFVNIECWKFIRKGFACRFPKIYVYKQICLKNPQLHPLTWLVSNTELFFIVLALIKIRESTFILHVNMRNFKD